MQVSQPLILYDFPWKHRCHYRSFICCYETLKHIHTIEHTAKKEGPTEHSAIKKGASSVWHIFELSEWVSLALPINQNSNSHAHCTYCNSLGFMLHQNELRTQLESKNLKPQTSSSTNYILQHVVYEDNTITTVRNERGLFTLRKMGENAIHNKCQTLSNNTRTNNDEPNLSQSPLSSCKTLFCIRR